MLAAAGFRTGLSPSNGDNDDEHHHGKRNTPAQKLRPDTHLTATIRHLLSNRSKTDLHNWTSVQSRCARSMCVSLRHEFNMARPEEAETRAFDGLMATV